MRSTLVSGIVIASNEYSDRTFGSECVFIMWEIIVNPLDSYLLRNEDDSNMSEVSVKRSVASNSFYINSKSIVTSNKKFRIKSSV